MNVAMDNYPPCSSRMSNYNYNDDNNNNDAEQGGLLATGETQSVGDETASQAADDNLSVSTRNSEQLADAETRAVSWFRTTVLAVLSVATVMVSWSVYLRSHHAQLASYQTAFDNTAEKLIDSFQVSLDPLEALAVDFTSYAHYSQSSWPQIVLPDFVDRAEATRKLLSHAGSLWFVPVVHNLGPWESFSVENQDWLQAGSHLVEKDKKGALETAMARRLEGGKGIHSHVFDFGGDVSGTGPFLPLWETSPVTSNLTQWVNVDLMAVGRLQGALQYVLDRQNAVVASVFNMAPTQTHVPEHVTLDSLINTLLGSRTEYFGEPASPLIFPLLENDEVVGLLVSMKYWRHTLEHKSPTRDMPVVAVVENECGQDSQKQIFTYEVRGNGTTYLGKGDLHSKEFHAMVMTTKLTTEHQEEKVSLDGEYCSYKLSVYPSKQMKEYFVTNAPMRKSILCFFVFLVAVAVFLLYDFLVEHRQKVVMEHALQSTAIVSSLFPEAVRERLFNEDEGAAEGNRPMRRRSSDGAGSYFSETPKTPYKNSYGEESNEGPLSGNSTSKPIADLFPHCTVCFADVSLAKIFISTDYIDYHLNFHIFLSFFVYRSLDSRPGRRCEILRKFSPYWNLFIIHLISKLE